MSLPQPASYTGNRFALVTPDDNSAPLIITTILTLVFSFLIFAIRIFIVKRKGYGIDDWALGAAHFVGVGNWTAVFLGLKYGLGEAFDIVEDGELPRIAKAVFGSRILLFIALSLSKLSVLFIIRSLFTWEKRQKLLLIDFSIVICIIWGIVSVITLSVACTPEYVLGPTTKCPNHILRLEIITVLDIITEVIIVSLPFIFLFKLHMSRQKKQLVIFAFSFRLPLIPLSILYLLSTTHFLNIRPSKPGVQLVPPILWQEVLLGYSLMSATIPCLKSFVKGFTHGGVGYLQNATYGDDRYQSGSGRSGESYMMNGLKKKRSHIEAGLEMPLPMGRDETGMPRETPQILWSVEDMPVEGASVRSHLTRETQESQRDIIGEAR